MRFNKKIVVFSLILILILSLSAVVRAAPPRGRSIASDHLDLNALEKAGLNNLLADQEGSGDDPSEDGNDGDSADEDSDDDTKEKHFVANEMANHFGVDYGQIMDLHREGTGFGKLAQALYLAQMMPEEVALLDKVETILAAAKANGWGQFKKENAGHPGGLGSVGSIMRNAKKGAPQPDPPGDSLGATALSQNSIKTSGNSNGNGHGQERNNGKSNGKGKK